jgi:hypothetical protein
VFQQTTPDVEQIYHLHEFAYPRGNTHGRLATEGPANGTEQGCRAVEWIPSNPPT